MATSVQSISPQQLGEEEVLDEDVAREVERVGKDGGDGDGNEDAIQVTCAQFFINTVSFCFST